MGVNGQSVAEEDLELTADGSQGEGNKYSDLRWRGATWSDIDVFRSQQGTGDSC